MDLIKVEGWTLSQLTPGEEPLIQDLDLAARLGYAQPEAIRKLIRRMAAAGQLGIVSSVETKKEGRGRRGHEYRLTETQALKVIARSKTSAADQILDEIIRVYQAWRRGQLPSPTPPVVSQEIAELRGSVSDLVGAVASLTSLVGSLLAPALPSSDAPRGLPSPSRALPIQSDLIPDREWKWTLASAIKRYWDFPDYQRVWQEFRAAGGKKGVHARLSSAGYQIREDVVRKIKIQLEEA